MAGDWLDKIDFPSGPGADTQYSLWTHPSTQSTYFYDITKNSWKTLASTGARLYSGTTDPRYDGIVLMDGDLWWDSHALELRVYHLPDPKLGDPPGTVIGYWVSSTNPQMSLEDPDRNNVIGTVLITGEDAPMEGDEAHFSVTRPYGGAPDSMVEYLWKVSPNNIVLNEGSVDPNNPEVVIDITILGQDAKDASIFFPVGSAIFDGTSQVKYNVTCTVSAIDPTTFVRPSVTSSAISVKPVPLESDPLEYTRISVGTNTAGDDVYTFLQGSSQAVLTQSGDEFNLDNSALWPNFFIIPEAIAGDRDSHDIQIATKPKGTATINDMVGTYVEDYGKIAEISGDKATGYLIQIDGQPQDRDVTLYFWNNVSTNPYEGELILKP